MLAKRAVDFRGLLAVFVTLFALRAAAQASTRLNTLAYWPGTQINWDEAGVSLRVPQDFVGLWHPTQSSIWLYTGNTEENVSSLTTAVLKGAPLQLTAEGALCVISTFCLHNGTDMQDIIGAAPLYLLYGNTRTADVLFPEPETYAASSVVATAAFHSSNTSNIANVTLLADNNHSLGVSVVTISANMSSAALANLTATVLSVLALNDPQVTFNGTATTWLNYINGQRLNVTSVMPRATLNSYFNANADGSCQAVVQGSVQRQGQWGVYGQCLSEIRSQGNTYHKMQHEVTTGNVFMAAQKFELSNSVHAAASGASVANGSTAAVKDYQEGSPCTYTQANGTAVLPKPCSQACILSDGTAAQPTLSCTIGNSSDMTCTTCGGALGNIPLFDLEALPAATADQPIISCGSNCAQVIYLAMVRGIPASLCNTSCAANEQAWAHATLSQPVNTTIRCNATCQAAHDSFIARIQSPVVDATAKRHRSLLQAPQTCVKPEPCPPAVCNRADAPEMLCAGCSCTLTYTIAVSVLAGMKGSVPAKCGSAPPGTTFVVASAAEVQACAAAAIPETDPNNGLCQSPPAITCDKCLNGNDLDGSPVNDATRCSDPVYDDPPPSGKIIYYICTTCGNSFVGLNHRPCSDGVCSGNGCAPNDRTCRGCNPDDPSQCCQPGGGFCSGSISVGNVGDIVTGVLRIGIAAG